MEQSSDSANGNVALTLTKEYCESHQGLFKRTLMKEIEDMVLRDVRVQQKSEQGRLTSLMSKVTLADVDMDDAHFSIDFQSEVAGDDVKCVTDFEIALKLTNFSMVFEFEQWFEAESSVVVEEWGAGRLSLPNMTFNLLVEPYVNQEKFRLKIKDQKLQIGDY